MFPIFHPLSSHILSFPQLCALVHTFLCRSLCCWLCSRAVPGIRNLQAFPRFSCYLATNTPCTPFPTPHSANLSPRNLSNSPCTHSALPFICCSLHPPLLHFLALSALAAWQLLEHSPLSSYHRLTEVRESTWMCKCMFGNNRMSVYTRAYVCHCNVVFLLRCSALVFSKTIQTMSETGFYYNPALYGSSTAVYLFSVQEWGLKWY